MNKDICELCGSTEPTTVRPFVSGGRVFDGPICDECGICDQCGEAITVVDNEDGNPFTVCDCVDHEERGH